MRAVLDTVVFVRALINPKSRCGRIVFDHADRYTSVTSPAILREVLEVIYRSHIRSRFPEFVEPGPFEAALALFRNSDVVQPTESVAICRDPKDNKFFDCGIAGSADYIVSEDSDVLDVHEYRGIRTVAAEHFIALLETQ